MKSFMEILPRFSNIKTVLGAAVASLGLTSIAWSAEPSITQFCGTKPIKVGLATGFNGNSWRQISRAELEDEASKCKNITEVVYADGQLNPQKAISDIQGLVAQGVNALVVFPDAGPALLPAIRDAYKSGVAVVPYISSPGGQAGRDYVAALTPDNVALGRTWATWTVERLKGKGLVAFLGGTPGGTSEQAIYAEVKKVFAAHPDMKLLEGIHITNYTAADAQKTMTGLLAQHPDIAAVISSYGGSSVGAVRAFATSGRKLVPFATSDMNELGCEFQEYKPTNPGFELLTTGSWTSQSRAALRKAVAATQGLVDNEPNAQVPTVLEDSSKPNMQPRCDKSLPLDVPMSAMLSRDQLKVLFSKK